MKHRINPEDWLSKKDCGTYDTHIKKLKQKISNSEKICGYCSPEIMREIIAGQIREITLFQSTHRHSLWFNRDRMKNQIDSLNNIIRDLNLYLKIYT